MNIRGSEIGRCHQYLAIKALGLPLEQPSSYLQKIFDAGNRQEDEAIAWLQEHTPVGVIDRQREVVYKIDGHTITGHIDGIEGAKTRFGLGGVRHDDDTVELREVSIVPSSRRLLEVKAMSQERFAYLWSGKLEPAIADQVAAYCLALLQEGEEIEGFAVLGKLWEKEQYYLYRLSGDDFISWLDTMQERIDRIVAEVAEVVKNIQTGDSLLPRSALPIPKFCLKCAARYHCYPRLLEKEKMMAEDFMVSTDVADIGALEKYKKGKAIMAKGEELVAEAKVQFERVLSESYPRKVVVEGVGTVSRVTSTRKKWNYKAVEDLLGEEDFALCYDEQESTSLRIALQKEE